MQRRIYFNFAGLILLSCVLLAVSFGFLFYTTEQRREKEAIRQMAHLTASLLHPEANHREIETGGVRMTLLDPNGRVLYDSYAGADISENRGNRPEVVRAFADGIGEDIRRSDTLNAQTFYYAIRLDNGAVLRFSRTLQSLRASFIVILPLLFGITAAVLFLAYSIAHRLTLKIIKPLEQVDFENNDIAPYDELTPYVQKINRQKQEIREQIAAYRRTERQRKEFSANVSHELKTPLTAISALAEMMAGGMVQGGDIEDFAKRISKQAGRLILVIDDIIRLSEFDEGKVEKDFTVFNIHEAAQSVITALQDKADEKQVTLALAGRPFHVKANHRLIDELMYNLVDNGIKYNKEGGQVTLRVHEEDGFCRISVADTGIGIAPEHQPRVFERFYRADTSRSKKTGGTGLGLSIVKHITEHHKGTVALESTEGAGTTVVCSIPVNY